MSDLPSQRQAILARDAAMVKLRRLTIGAIAAATGIAGAVVGVAAASTHARTAARIHLPATRAARIVAVPAPSATTPVAGADQSASAAPPSPPVASSSQPVVVSGGS